MERSSMADFTYSKLTIADSYSQFYSSFKHHTDEVRQKRSDVTGIFKLPVPVVS